MDRFLWRFNLGDVDMLCRYWIIRMDKIFKEKKRKQNPRAKLQLH